MTQRDGMGRDMGGGFRMGNTCTIMADSYQCMAKNTKKKKAFKSKKNKCIVIFKKLDLINISNFVH